MTLLPGTGDSIGISTLRSSSSDKIELTITMNHGGVSSTDETSTSKSKGWIVLYVFAAIVGVYAALAVVVVGGIIIVMLIKKSSTAASTLQASSA